MSDLSERLKLARERAGYQTASLAAEAMGVSVSSYVQHENGTRGFKRESATKYARFFRVSPEWLLLGVANGSPTTALGPTLYVKGEVAAGVWRDAWEYQPDEWEAFTGRADISRPIKERFGLRVVGESMNRIYPPGTIIECVHYDSETPLQSGKRVVIERKRMFDGIETTVKEFRLDGEGVAWLWPCSDHPEFQTPFRPDLPEEGIESVKIIATVVASIRIE